MYKISALEMVKKAALKCVETVFKHKYIYQ